MATASQIDKLTRRIDEIAIILDPTPNFAVVVVPHCLDYNAVMARHFELYPEDQKAKTLVVLWHWGDADPEWFTYNENLRSSAAWRQIAREEAATIPADELRLLRDRRRLAWAERHGTSN